MAQVGFYLLYVALGMAALGVVTSAMGAYLRSSSLVESGQRAALATTGLLSVAMLLLARLFLLDDFSVQYVAEHSSRDTPLIYKLTAVWAGQSGSLLLWVWIQSLYGAAILWGRRRHALQPYATAVLTSITAFFLVTLCFASNPFIRLGVAAADGVGLNPLLQNAMMAIHPPTLYVGYVGFSVPFAFAIAALLSGRLDDAWIRTIRRWTLFTWFVLGIGVLLGSWWAYLELGWGGYWGWDPVENASLMPWLTGTAFLHSVMIQETRRMLKIWNIILVSLSFSLTILGTFITRSGVISSVHSFAQSEVGYYFLFFLFVIMFGSMALILHRLPELRAENRIEAILSRESSFLFNNVLFVAITFAVLWGTLFPILSEWVRGTKITVTQTWFNTFNVPLGLALLLLTGIGPLLAWRKTSASMLVRNFALPAAVTVAASVVLFALGVRGILANMAFTFGIFVLATTALEFFRGARARMKMYGDNAASALWRLTFSNTRRYGGYVVHISMVLIFAGIAGSSAFQQSSTHDLAPGESFSIGAYVGTYSGVSFTSTPRAETYLAEVDISRHGRPLGQLHPAKEFFPSFRNQPATEVDIRHTLTEDLYLVLLHAGEDGRATFKVYLNPMVSWIWLGGLLFLFGGVVTMMPDVRERRLAVEMTAERSRAAA